MNNKQQYIRLAKTHRLQWEEAQQSYVLLFPEGMVQLNGPAAEILKLCPDSDGPARLTQEIITELEARFPDVPTLANDVCEFMTIAEQKGWVELD